MPWPFELGKTYNRRRDVHARYAGQQQGGIITPKDHPLVIAITGEEGEQHGYTDRLRPDGVFEYYGEGQVGPMRMIKGNLAIESHSARGKSLLLFRKIGRDGSLRFEGEWLCDSYDVRVAPDRNGSMRDAFVFLLRPLEAVVAAVEVEPPTQSRSSLAEMRSRAIEGASAALVGSPAARTVYTRSRAIRQYVLARAAGQCEGCRSAAPFKTFDGSPYLEPHHIRRVSDGGPDHPRHVIALCPNCHRRVHFSADGASYNAQLGKRIAAIEPS